MTKILLKFIHVSDTHLHADPAYGIDAARGRPATLAGGAALVKAINAVPFDPDFVLHTGDVAYDPDPAAHAAAREVLGAIRWPVHCLAGNHDHRAALQRTMLGTDDAASLNPFHYAFDVNGVRIVCLDSTGPAEPPRGYVSPEQIEWLRAICSADDDRPIVVGVHHNLLPVGAPWWDEFMRCANGEAVHDALLPARDRIRGVFHGHVHQNVDVLRDGILYSSCLSSWCQFHCWPGQEKTVHDVGAEPGFSLVTVTREQTFVRRCRFHID